MLSCLFSRHYVLKGTATIGEQHWPLEKEFSISATAAKKYNQKAVDLAEEPFPWLLISLIGGGVFFLIAIIGILLYRMNKRTQKKKKRGKPMNPRLQARQKQGKKIKQKGKSFEKKRNK